MALVKLTDFGGLLPALSHRALPPGNATVAQSLVARVTEFRPLLDKTTCAAALSLVSPKTIYRMPRMVNPAFNTARFNVPFTDSTPADVSSFNTTVAATGAEATFTASGLRVRITSGGAANQDASVTYGGSLAHISRAANGIMVAEFYVTRTSVAAVSLNRCFYYFANSGAAYHDLGFTSTGLFRWILSGVNADTAAAIPVGVRTKITLRMEANGTGTLAVNDEVKITRSVGTGAWTVNTLILGANGGNFFPRDYLVDDVTIYIGEPDERQYIDNTGLCTGWINYADHTNLVPSQINGLEHARTYVTDGAGAYAPRVIDITGEDRLLGVPEPAAPGLTVNEGDYFTAAERADAVRAAMEAINAAIAAACTPCKIGAPWTNNATEGYLEDGAETGANITLIRYRVHQYDALDGTIVDAYTAAAEADVSWLRATRLGIWAQGTGTPTWYGSGVWHYQLAYTAYGYGVRFDSAACSTALTALTTEGGGALLTPTQVTQIVSKVAAIFNPEVLPANAVVAPLRAAVTAFEAVLDKKPQGALGSTEASDAEEDALDVAAEAIFAALMKWANVSQLPT